MQQENMDLKNHCLFCLEQIVPYNVTSGCGGDGGGMVEENEAVPDFHSLCSFLKIRFPKNEVSSFDKAPPQMPVLSSLSSSTCDKFLCLSCFGMVEQLTKLHKELEGIQRMIVEAERRIREVVLAHDISSNLSSGNKARREEFGENVWKMGMGRKGRDGGGRGRDNECLAFVEMFQSLVRSLNGSNDTDTIPTSNVDELIRNEKSAVISAHRKQRGRRKNNDKADQIKLLIEEDSVPIPVKVETGEDDYIDNLVGREEDALDPFAEFQIDPLSPSGSADEQTEMKESQPGSEDDDDDVEWKPPDPKKKRSTLRIRNSKPVKPLLKSKRKYKRPLRAPSNKHGIIVNQGEGIEIPEEYKCQDCDLSFITLKKKMEHRSEFHPSEYAKVKSFIASIPTVKKPDDGVLMYVCTICGEHVRQYQNPTLLHYMEHMLTHDMDESINPEADGGPHGCPDCDEEFQMKLNLELHRACLHHPLKSKEWIKCDLCPENMMFDTGEELRQHLKSEHHPAIILSCKHCSSSYTSFDRFMIHIAHKHQYKGVKKFKCPECFAEVGSTAELKEHCYDCHPHLKETFKCEKCERNYDTSNALALHMQRDHGYDRKSKTFSNLPDERLTCPQCRPDKGTTYKTEFTLRAHIRACHGRKQIFKCDQCEKICGSKQQLQKHVEVKHEHIRYPCPHCPKSYTESAELGYHMRVHTGEGLLVCEVCSKEFPRLSQLKSHVRSNHQTLGPDDRKVCDVCGKGFLGEHRLAKHKKQVHGEKKYECKVCGIRQARAEHLRSHMRTHTGERPHVCPICKKDFNRRDIMRIHVKGVHKVDFKELEEKEKEKEEV